MKHPAWLRIIGPSFVACVDITEAGLAYKPSTIIGYMRGWDIARVREYAAKRRWVVEEHADGMAP